MVFQQRKPLDYYSKKLTPVETNYITGNKKMFAVVVTLKHWRHLTQKIKNRMFVHTDHKNLLFFLETKQLNPKQIRWLKNFACYDFAIKYIKNENNVGADALNKKPDYKNRNKMVKLMLIKNGNYMQITEKTEKNENIIKNVHDTKLIGHQFFFKTLKKIPKKRHGKHQN